MQAAGPTVKPVTVVVPMYGHLPSLERCIRSILEHVDLAVHSVLLVNDSGPEADAVEQLVLSLTTAHPAVRYERNPSNLGFVRTCNRAVLELDTSGNDVLLLNSDARLTAGAFEEMLEVLAVHEKHGIVFPRSNNASIASVPLMPLEDDVEEDDSTRVYSRIVGELPRFAITPIAVGFCFLVRRVIIDNYGLFDEVYSPGYSEENDFCLRVNKFGYSSVMANRAFVFHEGARSFTSSTRSDLQKRNEARMLERFTFYPSAVAHYLQYSVDPVDWFADRIHRTSRPRVLIDLHHMSLIYNGSTRNALSFLELLASARAQIDADFVIASSVEAIEFFQLRSFGFDVVPNGTLDTTFDLGFALSPVSSPHQLYSLNRHCVRIVVSHFDVIALRINSLLEVSFTRRQAVLDALRLADRVIPISHAALDDIDAYFGAEARGIRERSTVIHEGVADTSFRVSPDGPVPLIAEAVSEPGYVLVVGNVFSHKQFPEAIAALTGNGLRVVAFGAFAGTVEHPADVTFIEGGHLSDEQMDVLYRRAAVVVFPSAYEGFGLPIAEAAERDRPLVIMDTTVGREVVESLGVADLTRFFTRLDELPGLVADLVEQPPASEARRLRTISDYNAAIVDVLLSELAAPVDLDRLRARTTYVRSLELYAEPSESTMRMKTATLDEVLRSRSYRLASVAAARLSFLRPALRPVARVVRRLRR